MSNPLLKAVIILIILSVGSAIFLQSKYKTAPKIQSIPTSSPSASSSASISPSPSLPPFHTSTPKPSLTPYIIPSSTPSPTPSPTPTPTPKPILSSMKLSLGRSSNSIGDQASGEINIQVTDKSPHYSGLPEYSILSFRYDITLRNMESERGYLIYLCQIDEGNCNGVGNVKTNSSGYVSYSGGAGITYNKNVPIKYIKVVQSDGGSCSNAFSPCLRADYPLLIP